MNLNASEVFGFSDSLIYFIRDLYDELSETGINVDAWLAELEEKKISAEHMSREQEKIKAMEEGLAVKTRNALAELYGVSSERLNALIVALSKGDDPEKSKLKIRNKIKLHGKKAEWKVA
jgi:hypothetical protein